jgi:alkylhydroperoxidase family enzyme
MARIPLVDPATAPPDVQAVFDRVEASGLPILNVMKLFGNRAQYIDALSCFVGALYEQPRIAPRYRELAYLRASQLNACHY